MTSTQTAIIPLRSYVSEQKRHLSLSHSLSLSSSGVCDVHRLCVFFIRIEIYVHWIRLSVRRETFWIWVTINILDWCEWFFDKKRKFKSHCYRFIRTPSLSHMHSHTDTHFNLSNNFTKRIHISSAIWFSSPAIEWRVCLFVLERFARSRCSCAQFFVRSFVFSFFASAYDQEMLTWN